MKKLIYLFAMLVLFSCDKSKQDDCFFSGKVISLTTKEPVPDAELTLELEHRLQCGFFGCHDITRTFVSTTMTDAQGDFTFDVSPCNQEALGINHEEGYEYIITGLKSAEYSSYRYYGDLADGPKEVEALNLDTIHIRYNDTDSTTSEHVTFMFFLDGERYFLYYYSVRFHPTVVVPRGVDFTYSYIIEDSAGEETFIEDIELKASDDRNNMTVTFE